MFQLISIYGRYSLYFNDFILNVSIVVGAVGGATDLDSVQHRGLADSTSPHFRTTGVYKKNAILNPDTQRCERLFVAVSRRRSSL
jgi:hypothetical protein